MCSVLPALADNIKSTIIGEVKGVCVWGGGGVLCADLFKHKNNVKDFLALQVCRA